MVGGITVTTTRLLHYAVAWRNMCTGKKPTPERSASTTKEPPINFKGLSVRSEVKLCTAKDIQKSLGEDLLFRPCYPAALLCECVARKFSDCFSSYTDCVLCFVGAGIPVYRISSEIEIQGSATKSCSDAWRILAHAWECLKGIGPEKISKMSDAQRLSKAKEIGWRFDENTRPEFVKEQLMNFLPLVKQFHSRHMDILLPDDVPPSWPGHGGGSMSKRKASAQC
jgi:hypothetical protein